MKFVTIYFRDRILSSQEILHAQDFCGVDISWTGDDAINVYGSRAKAWQVAQLLMLNVEEIAG